jgi:hypothetical protein
LQNGNLYGVAEWQQILQLELLDVVFTLLHAIEGISKHLLNQSSLLLVFNLVKHTKAIGGLWGTASVL